MDGFSGIKWNICSGPRMKAA
jgi:hypothetical protein